MKRAALINDLSGFGRCSLTAGMTVLAAMGIEACPLPTAVLSAQTGYPGYVCQDQTKMIPAFLDHWEKMGAVFDGILIGFLTGEQQAVLMQDFLARFRKDDTLFLLDPVMADGGCPYANFSEGLLRQMQAIAEKADVLTPNISELCLLAGGDLADLRSAEESRRKELLLRWADLIPGKEDRILIVTGIPGSRPDRIGSLLFDQGNHAEFEFSRSEGSFSGTGDLFAAVVLGELLRGGNPEKAVCMAGEFLSKAVESAAENHVPENEGSEYEKYLWMLQKDEFLKKER